jgi:hypothetical protein
MVLAAVALLEALEHLVLAGSARELHTAVGDICLVTLELELTFVALGLDSFDERLAGGELGGADGDRLSGSPALLDSCALEVDVQCL